MNRTIQNRISTHRLHRARCNKGPGWITGFLFVVIALAACTTTTNKREFTRTASGMYYKVIKQGDGENPAPGETVKMHVKQVYKDSVLSDTRTALPYYQPFDTAGMSPESYEVFSQVTKGDSIVFWIYTDSAFKDTMPSFAKKGERLYTTVYIEEILPVKFDVQSDVDREKLMARQRDSIRYFREHPNAPVPR